jgi:hypothetical protein
MIGAGYKPARPKVSVWMYCGETEQQAREAARKHMTEFGVSCSRRRCCRVFASCQSLNHWSAPRPPDSIGCHGLEYRTTRDPGSPQVIGGRFQ